MVRRVVVVVVVCLLGTVVASAAAAPPGRHGGLRLEVLSGPAEYVSGGAARLRVHVPRAVPLDAVRVAVNGSDVTGGFAADGHALEGVLRASRSARAPSPPRCRAATGPR